MQTELQNTAGAPGSFTEMGQALDAAVASRATGSDSREETSVSSGTDTKPSDGNGGSPSGSPTVPVENPGDTAQSHAQDSPAPAGGDKGGTPSPSTDPVSDRKKWNQWQAQRRIAAKEERKRRYEETRRRLEEEHAKYSEQGGEFENPQLAAVKQDQLRELEIRRVQEAQQAWEEEAYSTFSPEDAATFIKDSQKLSDWLNNREPEVLAYLDKPYGKHLLKGWMDKVAKNPEAAAKWTSMNSFEKYTVLSRYYAELENFGRAYAEGRIGPDGKPVQQVQTQPAQPNQTTQPNTPPAQAVPDTPVPGSGRNTSAMPATDNFALMLQDAMNKRGIK